jgi:hypothetical protein
MNCEPKLSKLQKFILTEALKTLPEIPQIVRERNMDRAQLAAFGFLKPGAKVQIEPADVEHISRTSILTDYFKLTQRKRYILGEPTDWDTWRINTEKDPVRYNRASASAYRAIRRLEARGLITRMVKDRGNLQLTQKGIAVAESLLD